VLSASVVTDVSNVTFCVVCICVYIKDVASFPELALSCVLLGHLDNNEYLTVDSATLLHCPGSDDSGDDESYCHSVEAHVCLAAGILPLQPRISIDEHQLCCSSAIAETVILRLSSLFKQLLLLRLRTQSATYHSMCVFLNHTQLC